MRRAEQHELCSSAYLLSTAIIWQRFSAAFMTAPKTRERCNMQHAKFQSCGHPVRRNPGCCN
jgi:hypothetical protein